MFKPKQETLPVFKEHIAQQTRRRRIESIKSTSAWVLIYLGLVLAPLPIISQNLMRLGPKGEQLVSAWGFAWVLYLAATLVPTMLVADLIAQKKDREKLIDDLKILRKSPRLRIPR